MDDETTSREGNQGRIDKEQTGQGILDAARGVCGTRIFWRAHGGDRRAH